MKKLISVILSLVLILSLCLTGCGNKTDEKVIKVGATPAPHAEILEVIKDELADLGWTLEIVEFDDYILPNQALEDGELDANYFQHVLYLESFNEEYGTHLVNAGGIHYEPFGIYAGKCNSLSDLPAGAKVGVPNDTTNEARALLLLEQEGLIKLKDGVGLNATKDDIVENPKNLEIIETKAELLTATLQDVDIAVINGNYAIDAGLKAADALAIESAEGTATEYYQNVIAVKDGNQHSDKTLALLQALKSEAVKQYIESTYNGAVVPLF